MTSKRKTCSHIMCSCPIFACRSCGERAFACTARKHARIGPCCGACDHTKEKTR